MEHYLNICPQCGSQDTCRCPSPTKTQTHGLCVLCKNGVTSVEELFQLESALGRLMEASPVRVASTYKKKREVPSADGKGTTTIYEYSERQIANRHKEKADRIEALRKKIPDLRKKVIKDLESDDVQTRMTALAIALIDETYERVGNSTSAKENKHYGVTTWEVSHVKISGGTATIKYTGKSGVDHEKKITDKKVVSCLKKAIEGKKDTDKILCGDECTVDASHVNEYLKPYDITAKDLRGLHANREVQERLEAVRKKGPSLPKDKKEKEKLLKEEFLEALEGAAEAVGHEAATLRSQYLVPGLEENYLTDGSVLKKLNDGK